MIYPTYKVNHMARKINADSCTSFTRSGCPTIRMSFLAVLVVEDLRRLDRSVCGSQGEGGFEFCDSCRKEALI